MPRRLGPGAIGYERRAVAASHNAPSASSLHTGADGSLTIVMQHDEPSDPARRANWLPTPPGRFRPLLRIYEPDEAVFNGAYELPPITETG